MKNPFVYVAAALFVVVPPCAMLVMQRLEERKVAMAIPPKDVPGQVVMYTSPG